jgi:hypothetical protein
MPRGSERYRLGRPSSHQTVPSGRTATTRAVRGQCCQTDSTLRLWVGGGSGCRAAVGNSATSGRCGASLTDSTYIRAVRSAEDHGVYNIFIVWSVFS